MVLTHTTNHTYTHPFPTVTLAYFLRYCSPQVNPFAAHVLSTDTISSHVDETTGRLHTTRIHLKRSRMPPAIMRLLPTSITGGGSGDKASYVLETIVVDIKDGWMRTDCRNLNFVGVLSVIEKQVYTAPSIALPSLDTEVKPASAKKSAPVFAPTTDVTTSVVYKSRLGDRIKQRIGQQSQVYEDTPRPGWFSKTVSGWGTSKIQASIETIASAKTQDQQGKSREGMSAVLERLRNGGVVGMLELARRAREAKTLEMQ